MFEYEEVDDDAQEVDDDVIDEGAEVEEEVDEPDDAATQAADTVDHVARIAELLGDGDDGISLDLAGITEREIERMDPMARAIVRGLRRQRDEGIAKAGSDAESVKADAAELLNQVRSEQDALAQSRKAFAEMFGNDKVKQFIAAGKAVDVSKLDPTSPDDARKILQAEAAIGLAPLLDEVITRADTARREASISDTRKRYAEDFSRPGFEDGVRAVLKEWKTAGQDIGGRLEEAVRERKLRDMIADSAAAKAKRVEAAQRSAARVGRRGTGAGAETIQGPPPEIRRDPNRLAAWVTANPKEAAKYAASLRR